MSILPAPHAGVNQGARQILRECGLLRTARLCSFVKLRDIPNGPSQKGICTLMRQPGGCPGGFRRGHRRSGFAPVADDPCVHRARGRSGLSHVRRLDWQSGRAGSRTRPEPRAHEPRRPRGRTGIDVRATARAIESARRYGRDVQSSGSPDLMLWLQTARGPDGYVISDAWPYTRDDFRNLPGA